MFLLKQILPAAIVAMMVAAGVCRLAFYWGKGWAQSALGSLALGLAYLSGHLMITGWVSFPPTDTTNWLPYLALAAAVPAALTLPTWTRAFLFAVVSAGALRLLLKPKFLYGWSLTEGCIWVACLAGSMVLLAIVLDRLLRQSVSRIEMPAFLLITCAGTFGALMLSGSMLLGQLAMVLAAAVLGNLLSNARKVALAPGIAPVLALLLVMLLISGYFFAELPASSAVLIAFAPVLALSPIRMPALPAFLIRAALVSIPILAALVLAYRASPPLSY